MHAKGVQDFGRPQRHDDVSLATPLPHAEPLRQGIAEVCALRIEASGRVLEVGKPRPVLQMKQGRAIRIPGDDVGTPRELVMLVRLVDPDRQPSARRCPASNSPMRECTGSTDRTEAAGRFLGSTSSSSSFSPSAAPSRIAISTETGSPDSTRCTLPRDTPAFSASEVIDHRRPRRASLIWIPTRTQSRLTAATTECAGGCEDGRGDIPYQVNTRRLIRWLASPYRLLSAVGASNLLS